MKQLLCDRTFRALALAGAILAAVVFTGEPKPTQSHSTTFWFDKLQWNSCADFVLLGDSRVLTNLAPKVLGAELDGPRVRNFGFCGLGYSNDYFDAAERILDPASRRRTVLLGVTPHSLSAKAVERNGFRETHDEISWIAVQKARWLGALQERLSPRSVREILQLATGSEPHWNRFHQHDDGWREVFPRSDTHIDLEQWALTFQGCRVDPQVVETVLDRTRKWASEGIVVFAFRPPTPADVALAEDRIYGFDEPEFAAAFERAGGVWLQTPQHHYRCYDGSHLDSASARRLSASLAREIATAQGILASRDPVARH